MKLQLLVREAAWPACCENRFGKMVAHWRYWPDRKPNTLTTSGSCSEILKTMSTWLPVWPGSNQVFTWGEKQMRVTMLRSFLPTIQGLTTYSKQLEKMGCAE